MGRTMQQIPHVSGAIVDWLLDAGSKPTDGTHETPQICICELGGTVGDIDCMLFLEAVRELRDRVGRDNFCLIQQTLVPICNGTQKTKPTQHTVKNLMCLGVCPLPDPTWQLFSGAWHARSRWPGEVLSNRTLRFVVSWCHDAGPHVTDAPGPSRAMVAYDPKRATDSAPPCHPVSTLVSAYIVLLRS